MKSQLQCYLRMYDFLSDKDVLSLLKKARKLGLCHCTDQASFKESSLCFSCCCLLLQGHPSIIVHLSLNLTLCFLVELPAPKVVIHCTPLGGLFQWPLNICACG